MRTGAFAIYHTWPDMKNAEYEVLQRMLTAADRTNKKAVVIDNGGLVLWAHPALDIRIGTQLVPEDVDFAISLHFESPRINGVYTYYALWQPVEFYADFGYQESVDKFSTHHDLLSCRSDIADNHALNIFSGLHREVPTPLPPLFHTLPEPFLAPRIDEKSSLFYIGINWERIGRPKGRFHDVLTKLDARGLIKIFGPELIQGVAPWAGFKTYSGELPFDGSSMLHAINECGVCLALSSKAHQNSGIMSNRMFEGLASGAAVIANPNALIDKYFKDVVYVVDDSQGEAFLEQQIISHLRQIRNDPAAATERVLKGQQILRDVCSLEGSLETLFSETPARRERYYAKFPRGSRVAVVLDAHLADAAEIVTKIDELSAQLFCAIDLHVIAAPDVARRWEHRIGGSVERLTVHPFEPIAAAAKFDEQAGQRSGVGSLVGEILGRADSEYFALMTPQDMVMHDHFAGLVRAMVEQEGAMCAVSGSLLRGVNSTGKEQRKLHELRVVNVDSILSAEAVIPAGRALFRKALFKPEQMPLLRLLDGQEQTLFLVAAMVEGPLAQTNTATHLLDEAAAPKVSYPAISNDLQQQFIRDHFNSDPRWADKMAARAAKLAPTPTRDPVNPHRWVTYHTKPGEVEPIAPDQTHHLRAGGRGLAYLKSGFSFPEENGVWVTGEQAVLTFELPPAAADRAEDYQIVLGMLGRRERNSGRMQHCSFIVNNLHVAYQAIPDAFTNVAVSIPINVMRRTGTIKLELIADHAEPVLDDAGRIIDPRPLSLLVNSLAVLQAPGRTPFVLPVGEALPVSEGAAAVRALVKGFYAPERAGTWVCGRMGEIRFRVNRAIANPTLHLKLSGRAANVSGSPQRALIIVNGKSHGTFEVSSEVRAVRLPLEDVNLEDPIHVVVQASHAEPVVDDHGTIIDPRYLGVGLFEIGVVDGSERPARRGGRSFKSRLRTLMKGSKK